MIWFKNQHFFPNDKREISGMPVLELHIRGIKFNAELKEKVSFGLNLKKYVKNVNGAEFARRNYVCVFWNEKGKSA